MTAQSWLFFFFNFFRIEAKNTNVSLLFFRKSALKKNMCFRKCAVSDVTKGLIAGPLKSRTNQTWTKWNQLQRSSLCNVSLCLCVSFLCVCPSQLEAELALCEREGAELQEYANQVLQQIAERCPDILEQVVNALEDSCWHKHTQLHTHTHTERSVLYSLTPNTLKMFPLLPSLALNEAFNV